MSKLLEVGLISLVIFAFLTGFASLVTREWVSPIWCFLTALWTFAYLMRKYAEAK